MFSRFFINRPIFASVLSIVIVLGGGIALFTLPIAQYPEIAPPTVEVSQIGYLLDHNDPTYLATLQSGVLTDDDDSTVMLLGQENGPDQDHVFVEFDPDDIPTNTLALTLAGRARIKNWDGSGTTPYLSLELLAAGGYHDANPGADNTYDFDAPYASTYTDELDLETLPWAPDTDFDSLSDGAEWHDYQSSPTDTDTDDDDFSDAYEVSHADDGLRASAAPTGLRCRTATRTRSLQRCGRRGRSAARTTRRRPARSLAMCAGGRRWSASPWRSTARSTAARRRSTSAGCLRATGCRQGTTQG